MSFLEEIRRRRLPQTAALYVAVAWGGTEILSFLIEALMGQEDAATARRYLAILLIAGFPAAMYLAWSRDLGLQARRLFSASVVAVFIGGFLVYSVPAPTPDFPGALSEASIAILPFDVCEERISDLPLSRGLTREVFTRLAQRGDLKVKGRVSVQTVLETSPTEVTVAELLGVRYLLRGVVCRDGLDLTVHTELLDDKGFIVWGNDYTESINQAGQMEEHLAMLVDNGVASHFGDIIAVRGDFAVNRKAHEQLLIGHGYLDLDETEKARQAYRRALEIQPDYAEAVWAMSFVEEDRNAKKPIVEEALNLAREVLSRDANDFKANKAAGRIVRDLAKLEEAIAYRNVDEIGEDGVASAHAQAQAYFVEAEGYLRTALAVNPSATDVRLNLALALDRQDAEHRKVSLEILQQGFDYDPFNPGFTQMAAHRLAEFGRLREAMELFDRFEALPQGKGNLLGPQLEILQNQGRIDEKLAYLTKALSRNPEDVLDGTVLSHLWWTVAEIAGIGLYDEAEALHKIVEQIPNPKDTEWMRWARQYFLYDWYLWATGRSGEVTETTIDECAGRSNEEILEGWSILAANCAWAFWESGDESRALELLEALQYHRIRTTEWAERQTQFEMGLALAYFHMGRMDEATPVLDRIINYLQKEVDVGVRHPTTLQLLADAYVMRGETQVALQVLDLAIDYGEYDITMCCIDLLSFDPNEGFPESPWNSLEDHRAFIHATSRQRALVDAQRSNIRALLSQNDMSALLAPLVSPD